MTKANSSQCDVLKSWSMSRGIPRRAGMLAGLAGLAFGTQVWAQPSPPPSHERPWKADSGPVQLRHSPDGTARVVYSTLVHVPGAQWLRLKFDRVELAGVVEEGSGSFLKITSLLDGGTQYLDAESARQWVWTSAYFNGDTVLVELLAYPGTGPNRLAIGSVVVGDPPRAGVDSICGPTDDRTLSSDPRSARHMPEGCTSWLWNDTNRMFGSAGHCGVSSGDVEQFNVPLSNSNGSVNNPPPEDQYPVAAGSIQATNGGVGNDWCYFAVFPNSNTGLTPFQRQGAFYTVASAAPTPAGQTIRITGYGTVSSPVPPTWNQVQKTHTGPYTSLSGTTVQYQVDTTGGNSGSAVQNESASGAIIGVHTHAGCTSTGGANQGTAIQHSGWTTARNNPIGLCRSGRGTPSGPLFALRDEVNNFGTCSMTTGQFAQVSIAPPRMEGLAYDCNTGVFYAVSNDTYGVAPGPAGRKLWSVNPTPGAFTYIANISGTTSVINGLAFDPATNTLYGIAQANGQLFTINTATAVATPVGSPGGGTIGGIEFDPATSTLFGLDDSTGSTRLVRINPATGAQTVIGTLGAGIADCNGLAVTDDGSLWTIDAATEQLLRINPATGAATVVGNTNGFFGASVGMSAVLATRCPPRPDVWTEQGDAGNLVSSAQCTVGNGSLNEIRGSTSSTDAADLFCIRLCQPGSFGATTVGGASWDTQLWLFAANGNGISFNDDEVGGVTLQSRLTSLFTSSLPANTPVYLGISGYDHDAANAAGLEIWADSPFRSERSPDGPGAPGPLAQWTGTGASGTYTIFLTGACYHTPSGPTCYANCDGSTAVPFLNVADFTCFLQRFAAGDPYANCDGSTVPPVLNVADFTCFLQAFAAGCSAP